MVQVVAFEIVSDVFAKMCRNIFNNVEYMHLFILTKLQQKLQF